MRKSLRDVVHAGLLAVHDAEAVADEGVRQRGELVCERAPLSVVLAGLPRVETQVLEQDDVAVTELTDQPAGILTDGVLGYRHGRPEQLGEPRADRRERELRVG